MTHSEICPVCRGSGQVLNADRLQRESAIIEQFIDGLTSEEIYQIVKASALSYRGATVLNHEFRRELRRLIPTPEGKK